MTTFADRYYTLLGGKSDSDSAAEKPFTQEGVAQDLGIPVEYIEDLYMVAEHRRAHRRMKIDWAQVGEIDGSATAAELLHTNDRYDLERSERWGEGLVLMYDRAGLQPKSFDDTLLSVSRASTPGSIKSSGQTGPHADPEQTFGCALQEGMRCYSLKEVTRATIRFAKSQAPEMMDLATGAGLQAAGRVSMLQQTPGSKVEEGATSMEEFSVEELGVKMSASEKLNDMHLAACEDASRVFPPRLMREGELLQDTEKLTSKVLADISRSYSELPWGLKMCGAYPLYKAVDNHLQKQYELGAAKELNSDSKAEFLMQVGLLCSMDAQASIRDILRRTAHCCAYAEAHSLTQNAKGLLGLVDQLVKVS